MSEEKSNFSELPIIDTDFGNKVLGNDTLAKEIFASVIEQLPSDVVKIQDAYSNQDWLRLESLVHKLHGALAYCGVPRLKMATAELEHAIKAVPQDIMRITRCYYDFQHEVEDVLKHVS